MVRTSLNPLVFKNWKDTRWAVAVLCLCVAIASLMYFLLGNRIIAAAYSGDSFEFLNQRIAAHRMSRPWGTQEHYFTLGRLLFSRILLIFVGIYLLLLAVVRHRDVLSTIRRFFDAPVHPVNLAVFRIVLFYTIFNAVDVSLVTSVAALPRELRVAPLGFGWFLEHLAPGTSLVRVLAALLLASSFMAMIGLFTRTSAFMTAALSFCVLGLPNSFGKIDHTHHHLVWFSAVLAASRCGAALSCDALVAAWKRANAGDTRPPGASPEFGLPLSFVMLLMGQSYFFAGFWKLWESGVDWVMSDNLKYVLYQKWFDLGGYTPFFRVDHYPLLCQLGALATIAFELSVIFLIFSQTLRPFIPVGGIFFHTMTDVFMRISFKELLRCYVVFLDWNAVFRRVGARLYKGELAILYDGDCTSCRRLISVVRVFDILGGVKYVGKLTSETRDDGSRSLDSRACILNVQAVSGERAWVGVAAITVLAARIPFFWPAVPILYVWSMISNRTYRRRPNAGTDIAVEPLPRVEYGRARAVIAIGLILFAGNLKASVARQDGWPFSIYPTFAGLASPVSETVELSVVDKDGVAIETRRTLDQILPPHRFAGELAAIASAKDSSEAGERLVKLGQLWKQTAAGIDDARYIRLYRVTVSTVPERARENPIRRELLLERGL